MDDMGVVRAVQGVVNQANKTSTQETAVKEKPVETAPPPPDNITVELKKRVDQILAGLKERGIELPSTADTASKAAYTTHADSYIDVLRSLLVGDTSVKKLSFDSVAKEQLATSVTPKLPAYPFDTSFLRVNLEYLRALVSSETTVDSQLAARIEKQLEDLKTEVQPPAQPPSGNPLEQAI